MNMNLIKKGLMGPFFVYFIFISIYHTSTINKKLKFVINMRRFKMQIFEKKHHYCNILMESKQLFMLIESDSNKSFVTEKKNMEFLYNSTFAGMLMENIPCEKVKDGKQSLIRMDINGEIFDCPEYIIKKILQKDFSKLLLQEVTEENMLHNEDVGADEKKEEAEPIKEEKVKEDVLEEETIPDKEELPTIEEFFPVKEEIKSQPVEIFIKTEDVLEPVFIEEEQLQKKKGDFIFDYYKLTLKRPEDVMVDEIELEIVPINTPDNNKKVAGAEFMVYAKSNGETQKYVSPIDGGRKSVNVFVGEHELLVRASWDNGKFVSNIYPAGHTLKLGYELIKELSEIRPVKKENNNSGHIVFYTSKNDKISIAPLQFKNDIDSMAQMIMCYEHDGRRDLFSTEEAKVLTIDNEDGITQVFSYWEDDLFTCEQNLTKNN